MLMAILKPVMYTYWVLRSFEMGRERARLLCWIRHLKHCRECLYTRLAASPREF